MHNLTLQGVTYQYRNDIKDVPALRNSFNRLCQATFDFDFAHWHAAGHWGDTYQPHVLMHAGEVVANVSVNFIHTQWQGQPRLYLQIGTVMTAEVYRQRGLADVLMRRVLAQYQNQCDAIYLYANGSVQDFYPRYGFVPATEYQYSTSLIDLPPASTPLRLQKLDMANASHVAQLLARYQQGQPCSELPLLHNPGLLMFYAGQFLSHCVYAIEGHELVVMAEFEGDSATVYGIFGHSDLPLPQLLAAIAPSGTNRITLGFTPLDTAPFASAKLVEEDSYLYVLQNKENLFEKQQVCLPLLSHA